MGAPGLPLLLFTESQSQTPLHGSFQTPDVLQVICDGRRASTSACSEAHIFQLQHHDVGDGNSNRTAIGVSYSEQRNDLTDPAVPVGRPTRRRRNDADQGDCIFDCFPVSQWWRSYCASHTCTQNSYITCRSARVPRLRTVFVSSATA